jgi:hypothetical protein
MQSREISFGGEPHEGLHTKSNWNQHQRMAVYNGAPERVLISAISSQGYYQVQG